jgi:hypothetical protein
MSTNSGINTIGAMSREDILKNYKVGADGRIRSPGKFEGEMLYVPYFWECYLNGCADGDNGRRIWFSVMACDRKQFPELAKRRSVGLVEDDSGFVREA